MLGSFRWAANRALTVRGKRADDPKAEKMAIPTVYATKEILGGMCVARYLDPELPPELEAKGITQSQFNVTVNKLTRYVTGRSLAAAIHSPPPPAGGC